MKSKEYMRGLGIGIAVTAIVFTIANAGKTKPMTDAQIIARAKQLGYVEKETKVTEEDISKLKNLTPTSVPTPEPTAELVPITPTHTPDVTKEPDTGEPGGTPKAGEATPIAVPTKSPTGTPVPTKAPTNTPVPTKAPTNTPVPTKAPTNTPVPTKAPTNTPVPTKPMDAGKEGVRIEVKKGMISQQVAKALKDSGAIENTNDFIKYLESTGLDREINVGSFWIPKGSDFKQIAHILTGK